LHGTSDAVVLVPLLFGHGHHVTHDLPAALAAAPHLTGRPAAPLGPHALLAEALHGRLLEAGFPTGPHGGRRPAVVLAAAAPRAPRRPSGRPPHAGPPRTAPLRPGALQGHRIRHRRPQGGYRRRMTGTTRATPPSPGEDPRTALPGYTAADTERWVAEPDKRP